MKIILQSTIALFVFSCSAYPLDFRREKDKNCSVSQIASRKEIVNGYKYKVSVFIVYVKKDYYLKKTKGDIPLDMILSLSYIPLIPTVGPEIYLERELLCRRAPDVEKRVGDPETLCFIAETYDREDQPVYFLDVIKLYFEISDKLKITQLWRPPGPLFYNLSSRYLITSP